VPSGQKEKECIRRLGVRSLSARGSVEKLPRRMRSLLVRPKLLERMRPTAPFPAARPTPPLPLVGLEPRNGGFGTEKWWVWNREMVGLEPRNGGFGTEKSAPFFDLGDVAKPLQDRPRGIHTPTAGMWLKYF